MADIEAPSSPAPSNGTKGKAAAKSDGGEDISFPAPKQAVIIYAPITYTFTQLVSRETNLPIQQTPQASKRASFVQGPWKDFVKASLTTVVTEAGASEEKKHKKRKIKVKIAAMLIKMINRLVAENIIAHNRVFLTRNSSHILIRILVSERTIPILLMRCERIGVGVVVGTAFGTSIEWCLTPNVTGEMQKNAPPFSLDMLASAGTAAAPNSGGGGQEVTFGDMPAEEGDDAKRLASSLNTDDEEVSIDSEEDDSDDEQEKTLSTEEEPDVKSVNTARKKQLAQYIADARREWLDTGSRLRVMQVLESVESGAALTFDYIAFVLLAAWVAAMGLISNSVATVIASMLLSPLMGPCLAGAFGAILRKGQLVKLGLMNEMISLMICILMGFIIGAIVVPAQIPTVQTWPSPEMVNRGNAKGLVMGVAVAIPSGMGVALSVLGRNSGGLTGVAISLSLLPPAVNAGLCWMTAICFRTGVANRNPGDDTDYALVGTISLCLTLVNICCIFIGGCFMFWMKEVSPVKNKNTFWSRDVKVERQHRRSALNPDSNAIKKGLKAAIELQEVRAAHGELHDDGDDGFIKAECDQYDDYMKLTEAKRKGLAANVLEDALFVGGVGLFEGHDLLDGQQLTKKVVPGGAISSDEIPDEVAFLEEASIGTDKVSLLDAAEKVGGLEEAGEILFAPFADGLVNGKEIRTNAWDDKLGDHGINHEDVAGAVLLF